MSEFKEIPNRLVAVAERNRRDPLSYDFLAVGIARRSKQAYEIDDDRFAFPVTLIEVDCGIQGNRIVRREDCVELTDDLSDYEKTLSPEELLQKYLPQIVAKMASVIISLGGDRWWR